MILLHGVIIPSSLFSFEKLYQTEISFCTPNDIFATESMNLPPYKTNHFTPLYDGHKRNQLKSCCQILPLILNTGQTETDCQYKMTAVNFCSPARKMNTHQAVGRPYLPGHYHHQRQPPRANRRTTDQYSPRKERLITNDQTGDQMLFSK